MVDVEVCGAVEWTAIPSADGETEKISARRRLSNGLLGSFRSPMMEHTFASGTPRDG